MNMGSGKGGGGADREGHQGGGNGNNDTGNNGGPPPPYPPYLPLEECLERYNNASSSDNGDAPLVIRGTLRVLPGGRRDGVPSSSAFVTCDRGRLKADVLLPTAMERNRAMDGDQVFVELLPEEEDDDEEEEDVDEATDRLESLGIADGGDDDDDDEAGDVVLDGWREEGAEEEENFVTWQDDPVQVDLWNPIVPGIRKRSSKKKTSAALRSSGGGRSTQPKQQRRGRVVQVVPPRKVHSELSKDGVVPTRPLVGTLKVLPSGTVLLTPNNKSLPQFKCQNANRIRHHRQNSKEAAAPGGSDDDTTAAAIDETALYKAEYVFGAWKPEHKWPQCVKVERIGDSFDVESEIQALLIENDVNHGDFDPDVLRAVDRSVESGLYFDAKRNEQGWKPTPEMCAGRRDYRATRIFTIDPTTAKDLDDALHATLLPDGTVEVGVHIADVSHFVRPGDPVDIEAQRRTTTVYLVDRTVPMLPRPLCEIACSLNEGVDRLAFSCVWRMNPDGTMCKRKGGKSARAEGGKGKNDGGRGDDDDVWYGRTVIRSVARLDYSTAQNIIEGKVAMGEPEAEMDESMWPASRRPPKGDRHTADQVAADVRLMHRVAMARRKLRFENGALALHGTKLAFQLDEDGQTPLLAQPYPIRDSNRLVEEYMLLANYLVAQRLITYARDLAVLRKHPEPLAEGLDDVVALAKAALDIEIDPSNSQTLHESLIRVSHQAKNDDLILQCITNLIMTPMQAAEYLVVGTEGNDNAEEWRHYALNIPYYTHFTSPIRRYPDVLVHRLLQATLDGPQALRSFSFGQDQLRALCQQSNDKRMAAKTSQERCDRIFLALFVKKNPLRSEKGVVLSVGKSTFTVFLPSLGTSCLLFLQEHTDILTYATQESPDGTRRILLQQKLPKEQKQQETVSTQSGGGRWKTLNVEVMTKLRVTVTCSDKPPVDIKLRLEGPYIE